MNRRDLVLLVVAALLVRLAASMVVSGPAFLDPAYYELVGRQLVAGNGFTTPALWSFLEVGGRLPENPVLPVPSNAHWMPLTSIASAASMLVLGGSELAAELPMILAGVALVPLTALVGWELWQSRSVALISGVLALFAGPMLVYVPMTDGFALFGLGGFLALYASMRAVRDPDGGKWIAAAGVGVGIATLTRIDGLLLAVAPATAWLIRRGIGPWRVDRPALGWAPVVGGVAVAALILAPWLVRQMMVFGSPLPSAGGHTLWITSYNEQFSIGHPVNLETYLAQGIPWIVASKLGSWLLILGRTVSLLGGAFALTFAYGMWAERRRPELGPFLVYWLLLFAVMGGLFTFHAPQGAWYHSSWAWLPFAIPLAVASFVPALAALGRRVRLFAKPANQRFLLGAAVGGAVILSVIGSAGLMATWRADHDRLESAAGFLADAAGPDDVVMVIDPPSLTLRTGLRSVPPTYDPYPVIGEVVSAYEVRWVVVERQPGEPRDPLGLWDGAAAVDSEGNRAEFLPAEPVFASGDVRVFDVSAP